MDLITQTLKRAGKQHTRTLENESPADRSMATPASETEEPLIRSVAVPASQLRRQKILTGYKNEPFIDAYRLLRTRVLGQMAANNRRTLGVTSANAHEGKSLTAINLGIAIAMEKDHSVIVVDTDLRRPSLHRYFGLRPIKGINDYLKGNSTLTEILVSPGIDHFAILPCLDAITGAPELLKSKMMHKLLADISASFPTHTIIYDLAPILVGDDAVAFSFLVDAMILVVEEGKTEKDKLEMAKELLSESNLIGTVLNKVNKSKPDRNRCYY